MAETTATKLALAERQLETAIGLFVSRRGRLSAITLAGAADGTIGLRVCPMTGLALKSGQMPPLEYTHGLVV